MICEQIMNRGRFVRFSLILTLILTFSFSVILSACSKIPGLSKDETITKTDFALNTFITVTVYEGGDEDACYQACKLIHNYELIFSATDINSELYKLNERILPETDGGYEVSEDLAHLIQTGIMMGEESDGAFDITIFPVKELWDFNAEEPALPDEKELAEALKHVDYRKVHVKDNKVYFDDDRIRMDMGALAKGYIADKVAEYLRENGVTSAIINLGGNIYCLGEKPDGSDFTVGIQKPFADHNETVTSVSVHDESVVTSGVYERCFDLDGEHYHHILNPKTGYPYDNGLVSVSIISESSEMADALTTTCFCLGGTEGKKLAEKYGAQYYFIQE